MSTPKAIKIASTLYDARDTARFIHGEEFFEKIKPFQEAIKETMAKYRCEALPAAMSLFTEINKQDPYGTGKTQVLLLAACVEMLDPSEQKEVQAV